MREFDRLVTLMARLRSPGGCPWDLEQTHQSIRKYVIEEAYEVAEAIDRDEPRELCSELGDLLLQVVFHARMAEESGRFAVADVCTAICDKLERRHPHVFGDTSVRDADEVTRNWEAIKVRERGAGASTLDGVPRSLPALQRAERISSKAAGTGFDWSRAEDVLAKVDEERAELAEALEGKDPERVADELGDLLFTLANLGRKLDVEAERALSRAVDRFERRFRDMETTAGRAGEDFRALDPDALEERWQAAKRRVDPPAGDR
ncbi:MAG: nucleoside triphosphate pyrophosphohydrolase [Deltaproteobacteria bacterium]|nr:nucleoside triphosphate pyrophosphohydrolase [Deltaproteobacteria bacterium]